MPSRYWLMKTEPGTYSIADLRRDGSTCWEGVRNYRARNLMREMKKGDAVLFYHSNAKPPGVAGLARVCREAYPDHFAFDKRSRYYDEKSPRDEPRWWMVDVEFVEEFPRVVGLDELKADPAFADMMVTQRGARLSVQPAARKHHDRIVKLSRK